MPWIAHLSAFHMTIYLVSLQYLDKIGTAFFGQPTTSSSSDGRQATNGIGGAGLMGLLGGGAGGGLLGK